MSAVVRGRRPAAGVGPADLLLLRAALLAGASPAAALAEVDHPSLASVNAALRVGTPLEQLAARGSALPSSVVRLLRTLAMADLVGSAASPAVGALLDGTTATLRLQALMAARSAQAVLSARLLVALPLVGAVGLALLDRGARGLLLSASGAVLASVALVLVLLAVLWMRVLLTRAAASAAAADPLVGTCDSGTDPGDLPTVELLELLALALSAGVGLPEAVRLVARIAAPDTAGLMAQVAGRLHSGMSPVQAMPEQLGEVGRLLDLSERFGAPTAEALRVLADDIRRRAAAAAETAAERLTVHLVFPTTLLLVPAFGLLVVVPTLASSLGGSGPGP